MGIFASSQNLSTHNTGNNTLDNFQDKYLGTSYILEHKADFEPGRTSDFILKVKFLRDLYDMDGNFVCDKDEASEALALSIRDFTGPQMSLETINVRTGNGSVNYAGNPSVGNAPISFTDYIGMKTEYILLAWYSMAHNIKNDKIGFKEYYSNDGILYKWAPNGTRQISWRLYGCWLSEYNLGQFSRQNSELRQFSTTIMYDKAVPFSTPEFQNWIITPSNATNNGINNTEYTDYSRKNYIGTQGNALKK